MSSEPKKGEERAVAGPWITLRGSDGIPLSALSICNTNLNESCDLKNTQLRLHLLETWKRPAPMHCRDGNMAREPQLDTTRDRLGLVHDKQ